MKVIIADFKIAKYGGIVEYVASMLRAFKDLGWEVDVAQLTPSSITQKAYEKKVSEFASGEHQSKTKAHWETSGYERDIATGYWRNTYRGYFLPPSNRIGVYEKDAVERWKELVKDVDIILWNFMPTKSLIWGKTNKKFDFWYKFFDLPSDIKQVFLAHDAYFNVRASNISALKDKILFLGCAHLAAYQCCSEIGIPRSLLLNPRYIEDDAKMPIKLKERREVDFFAAHMFKSMKHMEELVASVPYLNSDERYNVTVAGTGIEYSYMTSEEKIKPCYICNCKRDPDLPKNLDGEISLWNRAVEYGMIYKGQIPGEEVVSILKNTKFAVDPSWAEHYANYCNTHINGFIIEAMLCGAYPVLRDYRGLVKDRKEIYDPLFEKINAIIIPWDATPKEFGKILKDAMNMSSAKFLRDTKENFEIAKELFNSKKNAKEIIRLCNGGKKLIKEELVCGVDSDNVKRITNDIMQDFFGIELPIEWEN